jgi:pimeloyl-ACP methyl ester carboxylesterase
LGDHKYPENSFAEVNGVNLHYLEWSGTGVYLLLLAGFSNSAYIFKSFATWFTDHFRVVALTRRGHGQSEITEVGYDLDTRVEDIRGFLDHLRAESVVLVGHSMGGDELTSFVRRYPDRVRSLVYMDAALERSVKVQSEDPLRDLHSNKEPEDTWDSVEDFLEYCRRDYPFVTKRWDVWRDELLQQVDIEPDGKVRDRLTPELVKKFRDVMQDFKPDYSTIRCPLISFYAMQDSHPRLPKDASRELVETANAYWQNTVNGWIRENADRLQRTVKHSVVVEIQDAGHYLFLDKEKEVAEQTKRFLSQV